MSESGSVILRVIRRETFGGAVALAAACGLLLQLLLLGAGHATRGIQVPAATSAVHHLRRAVEEIDLSLSRNDASVTTASVHRRDHAEPQGQKQPTNPAKAPHCFWCILAKKLDAGLGPPPIVADVLSPAREAVRTTYMTVAGTTDHRLHSLPPLGPRAPPELV